MQWFLEYAFWETSFPTFFKKQGFRVFKSLPENHEQFLGSSRLFVTIHKEMVSIIMSFNLNS